MRLISMMLAFLPLALSAGFSDADYAQHVEKLKARTPVGFTIVVEKPFVVIGDESPASVRRWANGTIRWAVKQLKAGYFKKDPDAIIDIWLFKNRGSYLKHTWEIHRDRPGTPYGYYSPSHHALVMNIATGGGTLIHEIVHPFMESNFPACPDWFNEGLASLYEQSSEKNGKIIGLTNWRLAGLQRAIRSGGLPSFQQLCGTTSDQFRNQDPGTHYSQARYLCYLLQESGLLRNYYAQFVANHKSDPGGYRTLMKVLKETDMGAFQKRWERWVLGLRFP
ncbi:MAG: hypothetical protein ACPGVU_04035 [Limisphaerales bacterium]